MELLFKEMTKICKDYLAEFMRKITGTKVLISQENFG